MIKRYARPKIPFETWKLLKVKQQKMSKIYEKLTGVKKEIPLTKVIGIVAREPLYLDDTQLINFVGKKRRKIC